MLYSPVLHIGGVAVYTGDDVPSEVVGEVVGDVRAELTKEFRACRRAALTRAMRLCQQETMHRSPEFNDGIGVCLDILSDLIGEYK
jgi:hypothetical protein